MKNTKQQNKALDLIVKDLNIPTDGNQGANSGFCAHTPKICAFIILNNQFSIGNISVAFSLFICTRWSGKQF